MPRRKTLASLKDTEGPSPASTISPLQPPTLDEEQRTNIREYLDHTDKPFQIVTRPLSQKRKREAEPAHEQINSFDPRLSVHYEVKPGPTWDSLRRYKKFTVVSESIAVGECVLVAHGSLDTSKPNEIDVSEQWKAQVLDVRALDSEHVYVRVAWLNRPEDLESGRRPYHGKNELIPTNELDIIDAGSVNGRIDFVKWKEEEDDAEKMDEDQYFWRQTYDAATTRTFSKLKPICIDQTPQNPDEMIIQCSNPECRKWLHLKCIAEEAAIRHATSSDGQTKSSAAKRKSGNQKHMAISPKSNPQAAASAFKDRVVADVFIKGESRPGLDGNVVEPAERTEIIVTDGDQRAVESVQCLLCRRTID